MDLRAVVLFLHVLAAILWVGEMLVMSFILRPVARSMGSPAQKIELFRAVGRSSRPWIWAAMLLLALTGIGNLWLMGIPLGALMQESFYRSDFGRLLGVKLLFVLLLFALTLTHDLLAKNRRAAAAWLGRLSLLLGLIVVYLGVSLMVL